MFTLCLPARTSFALRCCFISTVSLFVAAWGKSEKQLFYSSTSLFLFGPRLSLPPSLPALQDLVILFQIATISMPP